MEALAMISILGALNRRKVNAMVCGCPHCKADIPASTPGGMCPACIANCEEHLNAIAQIHGALTILPKAPEAIK